MANSLVLRIKFPQTYPLIHKVVRIDSNLTVKDSVTFIGESLRVPYKNNNIGLYLPDEKVWLKDDDRIGSYTDIQDQEFIEFKERTGGGCPCSIILDLVQRKNQKTGKHECALVIEPAEMELRPEQIRFEKSVRVEIEMKSSNVWGAAPGLLVFVAVLFAQTTAADNEKLILLHTNDFHGNLEPDNTGEGGSAHIAWFVDQIREYESTHTHVLLIDVGDVFFSAPAISELLEGESTIDIYNMMGYQVAAIGNHEFDHGIDILEDRIQQSNFTWVSANIILDGTEWDQPSWLQPYTFLKAGTVVIGVLGLTTTETPIDSTPGVLTGLHFRDMLETTLHYYDEIDAACDVFIILAHCGTEDVLADGVTYPGTISLAQGLASASKHVAVIFGGHTNEVIQPPIDIDGIYIAEAGDKGLYVGQVEIDVYPETHTYQVTNGCLNPISSSTCGEDPDVATEVAYWEAEVEPLTSIVIGITTLNITRNTYGESLMGSLCSDGVLWAMDLWDNDKLDGSLQIAFNNPGGLRADITCPYTSQCNVTWAGKVVDVLVQGASLAKGMIQVSEGFYFEWWNTGSDYGVQNVQLNGVPISLSTYYRVAVNSFLAAGGDSWYTFLNGTDIIDSQYGDQESLDDYISEPLGLAGEIDPIDIPWGRAVEQEFKAQNYPWRPIPKQLHSVGTNP
ncbi:bifunctional metallophosphatase/5'-nucleotidase [Pelomyxa schiedti]|nr:bifunctional metallophosphatase/5'-nucleotidase [Pelomyxa schiedti]